MFIGHKIKITEAAKNHLQKNVKSQVCIEYPNYRVRSCCVASAIPEIFIKTPKS